MELAIVGDTPAVLRVACIGEMCVPPRTEPLVERYGVEVYKRRVVIGLAGVTFMDSGGINWLVTCQKRFLTHGGRMVLHSVPEVVRKVFDLLNLWAVLKVVATETDALALP